ncbi:NAD(P)-binding protein [Xylariaceae sp. FL1272]|nr:NAD(P)-binding protein [Xylariaceae sp. FL1272]
MVRENKTFVLAKRPKGDIVPGETFRLERGPAPTAADLKDGEILTEALYLSLDPAMRGYLNDARSYMPPVKIGEKMRGGTVSRVLASKSPKAKEGDIVVTTTGWTEVAIADEKNFEVHEIPGGGKITDLQGVLGLTGATAYLGLDKIGKPKPGETVVVSGAAGATGSVVGQIAKLRGARVIGIAGSEDKCEWLTKDLGFDLALNYKSPTYARDFAKATPDYIDVYWDNVGGEILELALNRAKKHARFVMCGSISGYNNSGKPAVGIRNIFQLTAQSVRMEGFIVLDFLEDVPRARRDIAKWLAEGKIKRKETIVKGGLEKADSAIKDLFAGKNTGKLLLEIKDPEAVGSPKL